MTTSRRPEDRIDAAIQVLQEQGRPVTPRTVRAMTGARMTACAAAVADLRAKQDRDAGKFARVPPEAIQAHFGAVWAAAYRAAVEAVIPEREEMIASIRHLRAEVAALETAVIDLEDERDQAVAAAADTDALTMRSEEDPGLASRLALLDALYDGQERRQPPADQP